MGKRRDWCSAVSLMYTLWRQILFSSKKNGGGWEWRWWRIKIVGPKWKLIIDSKGMWKICSKPYIGFNYEALTKILNIDISFLFISHFIWKSRVIYGRYELWLYYLTARHRILGFTFFLHSFCETAWWCPWNIVRCFFF